MSIPADEPTRLGSSTQSASDPLTAAYDALQAQLVANMQALDTDRRTLRSLLRHISPSLRHSNQQHALTSKFQSAASAFLLSYRSIRNAAQQVFLKSRVAEAHHAPDAAIARDVTSLNAMAAEVSTTLAERLNAISADASTFVQIINTAS